MSATSGPSTSKSAVAKLGAALEKFKTQAKSLSEPIKDGVIDTATRLVGISEITSKYDAEHQKVVDNLLFTTTRVLNQLPSNDQLPEEMREVVTALVTTVSEVEEKLKMDHGKLSSIVMAQISERVTDLNQKLDRHRLDFAVVGAVQTMKLVGGPSLGRPTELPAALLPPKPAHFCGRDDLVATIVDLLLKDESCRIPLLGPGGIGKTSIAVAAINNPDVKTKYGRHIWFISCESMTSAEGIVASLAASLKIPQDGSTREAISGVLSSCNRVLLVLDNLETIWDSTACLEVEALLQQLAASPGVSLLVTMRGAVSPAGVDWSGSFREAVQPLTLVSAREVWLWITGRQDEQLDELLSLLDGLPLAINLMAQHGKVMSAAELIRTYNEEKAALLSRGPRRNRLTSLEVSIELSLNSQSLREEPSTASILSVLCLLPDGMSGPNLALALPSIPPAGRAARLLLEAALVVRKQDRLCALAPVREYILLRHPLYGSGFTDLRNYHMQLTKLVHEFRTDSRSNAVNTLWMEFGNINAVLLHAWKSTRTETCATESDELTTATLNLSWVPRSTGYGDCSQLLKVAVQHCRDGHDMSCLAKLQQSLGDVLLMMNRYDEAMKKVEEAKGTFDSFGDRRRAAQCIQSIGDVLRMLDRYDEAIEKLEEAKGTFDSIGDRRGAAQCIQRIGDVLCMLDRYDESIEKLEEAKRTFDSIRDQLGAPQCIQSIGDVLRTLNRYDEAMKKLEEAKGTFDSTGNRRGAAQCTQSIGGVLCMRNRYDESMEKLEEAKGTFDSIGDELGAAQCTRSIGNVLRTLNRYDESMKKLEEAKGTFDSIGERLGAAQCTQSIGDVLAMLNRYDEAMEKLEEAQETFDSVGNRLGTAECTQSIGDVLHMLHRYDEAMEELEGAKGTFDSIGDRLGAAQCTRSIGNVLRMLDRYDEAMEKLEEAKGMFDSIGDRLGAAECTQRIGDVLCMLNRYDEAKEELEEAKKAFNRIGGRRDAAQCMRSIGDVLRMWNRYDEASEKLMEAKRVCEEISDVYGLAWTYRRLADLSLDQGWDDEGEVHLEHAMKLFDSIGRSRDVRACEAELRELRAAAVDDRTEVPSNMPTLDVPTPTVSTPEMPILRTPTSRLGRLGAGARRFLGGLCGGSGRRQG